MTIAQGYNCFGGIVLLTDSLESDGITKRFVDKLWTYEVQDDWGIAIASAGESDLADSFTDGLKEILGNSEFDEVRLLSKLKSAIKSVRISYADSQFAFLTAIYGRPSLYSKLFRVNDQSLHLGPVRRYQALGLGGSLASFLSSQLYKQTMVVEEAARLGIFTLARVKEHVDGCDGPISVVSFKAGDNGFRIWSRNEIDSIEQEFAPKKFKEVLAQFWKQNNPAPKFDVNVEAQEGGSARWIRTAKLGTKP